MVDEIHLKSCFDYVGGRVSGMAFNECEAASSAYVFMIRSLLSSYKDVAHILPVHTLSAETFYSIIKKVIVGLEGIGYNVLAVITDNNAINTKAMKFFATPPKLSITYDNPACPDRPLYYLIDSVHILKCIRNNWLTRKILEVYVFPKFYHIVPFRYSVFSSYKKVA
ncbi:hypothetical protein JTE90_011718 [Oedothorax gibbosus]|uniref:Transposable element P transposase-like RNase H domain-containing protein n=1 Tax=Oedothorax gibbosus TaxID=931172 RepID=A0AAV6TQ27_9ARAC|nr:hypothetical protein JTE90_011718 [Oedothorax gibbosus]